MGFYFGREDVNRTRSRELKIVFMCSFIIGHPARISNPVQPSDYPKAIIMAAPPNMSTAPNKKYKLGFDWKATYVNMTTKNGYAISNTDAVDAPRILTAEKMKKFAAIVRAMAIRIITQIFDEELTIDTIEPH